MHELICPLGPRSILTTDSHEIVRSQVLVNGVSPNGFGSGQLTDYPTNQELGKSSLSSAVLGVD